ncbi:hypothetical protein NEICINOT_04609 [Neisseria cinerea ATCC 14685]|uniref:Uncharacterized protein n=1 Tax=Neisseria cinerea ATCC 14685 TaxID=546262 RepID=D0W4L1_NEICI|nr:hypothetical protein NEICINOT_04609 [Neisseria cinerea ATCC 14685]
MSRVGRLAPQIGDYDRAGRMYLRSGLVGRLAPQIGDYDSSDTNSTVNLLCRKTCPTNRGLRHLPTYVSSQGIVGRLAPQIGDYDNRLYITFTT